ncbi:MAG: VIT and VWA domain-containing protein [Lentisphaeria bacterium]|nr:VIT and VWA domain-containing protein [Lentisphaeria bacterium]
MKTRTWGRRVLGGVLLLGMTAAHGAGTLVPAGSGHQAMRIEDHHLRVVINNGFARTEVVQSFLNPNDATTEAVYSFPLPTSASLSEVTVQVGEEAMQGEVVSRGEADAIYGKEKDSGNSAAKAEKNGFQDFRFMVANIAPQGRATIRFVYYQPLDIDTGMGRYVYPLEEGGTDDVATAFWTRNEQVEGDFSAEVELKSAYPVTAIRTPGFAPVAEETLSDGHWRLRFEVPQGRLDKDFILYYRLADDLPGRIEMIPYRASAEEPGTFMLVVTPGLDLQPLDQGADYAFVLDVSGSMQGKLQTLCDGVIRTLGTMRPEDRFRIVTFNDSARELTSGWVLATEENVRRWSERVGGLGSSGGTDVYAGLQLSLKSLDADRVSSLILVTDGVTNTGIVDPKAFHKLMKAHDVRVFGFLMGNSGNWPLMRTVCDASGGFYAGVSNSDDIIGQILKAKGKITHESLHAAELKISGVKVYDVTDQAIGKVYHGQQLVFLGRYREGGKAQVALHARLSGVDKVYATEFTFPEVATEHPELERLWGLNQIEMIEDLRNAGLADAGESQEAIRDLGIACQLVTDETSMIVLTDESFARHGVARRNQARTAIEHQAQSRRDSQPAQDQRVDRARPAFEFNAPGLGGGGALDPLSLLVFLGVGLGGALGCRRFGRQE